MSLLELFTDVDDFMIIFEQWLKQYQLPEERSRRGRKASLSMSEVMTIIIYFHQSHYRDFKAYYTRYVCQELRGEFPKLVSYTRFLELMPGTLLPLTVYLYTRRGQQTGINFIDSTPSPSVIISVFAGTRSLLVWLGGVKARWAGFLASNYI